MLHRLAIEVYRRLPLRLRYWVVQRTTPKYTLGVLVVLARPDGRVLAVRQRYRPGWFLPGGTLRRGETVAQAARRELREELGLAVPADPVLHDARQELQRSWVTWYASAELTDDLADSVAAVSPELAEVRWLGADELAGEEFAVVRAIVARIRG